jgi:FAD/FMN-containing dehydrogenase
MTTTERALPALTTLRDELKGRLIEPTDPDYDQVRTVMVGDVDRHPVAIARVANAGDVARVIRFASENGLELAVRSGGHSGAGHSTTEGGIVIDVRDLKQLDFDVASRTAWAGSGLTAGEYTAAAVEHGLATGFGDTGSVGLGGLILGGGVGYLVRKHGLTIDSLLAAEVVTADGEILEVDESSHPDLFWAIRGGGGNFGVVTRFKLRLQPLDGIVGGMLILPATAETIAGFIAASEAAPEELSTIANVMNLPPMPFVAEEHHGKIAIMGMICYAGDAEAGERAVAPFRALAEPLADMVKPGPLTDMYPEFEAEGEYRPIAAARTLFMDRVDLPTAAHIVERLNASDASLRAVQLRVLGGAMARVATDATAFAHRDKPILGNVAAFIDAPEQRAEREAWVEALTADLRGDDHTAYVNFLEDEGSARVHDAYPAGTWERLAAIKQRYDPTNLFRLNQNVPPA